MGPSSHPSSVKPTPARTASGSSTASSMASPTPSSSSPAFFARMRRASRSRSPPSYARGSSSTGAIAPHPSPVTYSGMPPRLDGMAARRPRRPSHLRVRSESDDTSTLLPACNVTSSPTSLSPVATESSAGAMSDAPSWMTSSTANTARRPRSRSQKRCSGTTMTVGRHSNDWLFGGFSFTDAVRGIWHPHDGSHAGEMHRSASASASASGGVMSAPTRPQASDVHSGRE